MSDAPNWLILAVLAVAIVTAFAPNIGRSLRRAAATITAARRTTATAWWPDYQSELRHAWYRKAGPHVIRHATHTARNCPEQPREY